VRTFGSDHWSRAHFALRFCTAVALTQHRWRFHCPGRCHRTWRHVYWVPTPPRMASVRAWTRCSEWSAARMTRLRSRENGHPTTIFRHNPGFFAQHGVHCNFSFARMNFMVAKAWNAAAQSLLDGKNTKPALQTDCVFFLFLNMLSFFGHVQGHHRGK
jgi:hypothetical protein